jgi:putative serine protease PepD
MSLLVDHPAPQAPREQRRDLAHRPGRGRAILLVVGALMGGATGAGALAATGALRRDSAATTTVVQRVTGDGSASTAAALNARAVYANAADGVVDITARGTTTTQASGGGPFSQPQSTQSTATGAGFVLDASGRIVTAAHVVQNATSITIKLQNGSSRSATVLGRDNATDIAVLKIDPTGLTLHPLALGSSASLNVGVAVAAIGDPFGYDRSISTGSVSGLDRTIEAPNGFTVAHAIQTDAALNPGNSGGPLLDAGGRVIGVVDQIATDGSSEQSSGVGFAVPIDIVAKEVPQLAKGQTIQHAYLGVSTSTATGATAGATVGQVTSGGPAAAAGLKAGDVVTAIDGTTVKGTSDLVAAIASHNPGDSVTLTVRRGSSTQHLTTTLRAQPTQRSTSAG